MTDYEKAVLRMLGLIANGQALQLVAQKTTGELGDLVVKHQNFVTAALQEIAAVTRAPGAEGQ